MKVLSQTYKIKAPISMVWEALTDPKIIDKWGGGPAKMKDKVGFEFSLWGGDVHGKNVKVVPEKLLVQEWFGGAWDKPSIATFKLTEKNSETEIKFSQLDIPDQEFSDIEKGWRDYYLGPLKDLFEDN